MEIIKLTKKETLWLQELLTNHVREHYLDLDTIKMGYKIRHKLLEVSKEYEIQKECVI